jgi:hypothetical protein
MSPLLPHMQLLELLYMLGRVGLTFMLLGLAYYAYWRFHPERSTPRK